MYGYHQKGVVLVIALIFLAVVTLLGVAALQTNLFGERMTRNAILREQTLQLAETGLFAAEDFVVNNSTQIINAVLDNNVGGYGVPRPAAANCAATLDGQGGLCVPSEVALQMLGLANRHDNWVDIPSDANSINVWSTRARHRRVAQEAVGADLRRPRYIVEFLGYAPVANGNSACDGIGATALENTIFVWPYCPLDSAHFRITVLASARPRPIQDSAVRVLLQSTFVL